jgi:hypothetical protein
MVGILALAAAGPAAADSGWSKQLARGLFGNDAPSWFDRGSRGNRSFGWWHNRGDDDRGKGRGHGRGRGHGHGHGHGHEPGHGGGHCKGHFDDHCPKSP